MNFEKPNYERMYALIDEVFSTRTDPNQIQVTKKQMKKLELLHPCTLSEVSNDDGPYCWILIIPTTAEVMNEFLNNKISEKEILNKSNPGDLFQSIYLCSATTLPEFRGKGLSKKICLDAIEAIRKEFPIENLYVWPFTESGEKLAKKLAAATQLKLFIKSVSKN